MFNPQEYLRVTKELNENELSVKCAISLIEKEMLEFARAPRLPWVEVIIPCKMNKTLRTTISKKYKEGGWKIVASVCEGEDTTFVFCTKEMEEQWYAMKDQMVYSNNNWLIVK